MCLRWTLTKNLAARLPTESGLSRYCRRKHGRQPQLAISARPTTAGHPRNLAGSHQARMRPSRYFHPACLLRFPSTPVRASRNSHMTAPPTTVDDRRHEAMLEPGAVRTASTAALASGRLNGGQTGQLRKGTADRLHTGHWMITCVPSDDSSAAK